MFLPRLCGGVFELPTTAPSGTPSVTPSERGSISMMPSSAPSSLGCVDLEDFEFEIKSGEMKDCAWLSGSEDRIGSYCNTKIKGMSTFSVVVFHIITCHLTIIKYDSNYNANLVPCLLHN